MRGFIESNSKTIAAVAAVLFILNGVLFYNLSLKQGDLDTKQAENLKEKDDEVITLKKDNENLKKTILAMDTKTNSSSKKDNYKSILRKNEALSKDFIKYLLEADGAKESERRNKLSQITSKEVLNSVAPENQEEGKEYSSDPTFKAKIEDANVYVSDISEDENEVKTIVDVNYQVSDTQGKSKVRACVFMTITKNESNKMIITDYTYFPMD